MVGFVIGLLVGGMIGLMLMAFIKVGDLEENYYIDLIQTYDKEVNRQYKVIKKAIEYIEQHNDYFLLKREVKELSDILKGEIKSEYRESKRKI